MTLLTTNVKDGDPNHAGLHNEERGAINVRRVVFNTIATPKTADYTAASWDSVTFDTTGGALTLTLPSSPAVGDEVEYFLTAGTNALTITGTGLSASIVVAGHGAVARWNGTAWVERQDRKTKAALDAAYGPLADLRAINIYCPENYGAASTYSGSVSDTTAVQNAINAAQTGKGRVWLRRAYNVSSATITVTAPITIEGFGTSYDTAFLTQPTVISGLITSSASADCLSVTSAGVHLSNFALANTATTPTAGVGLKFTQGTNAYIGNPTNCVFDNLHVMGFYDNISTAGGTYYVFRNCYSFDPINYGMHVSSASLGAIDSGDPLVDGCYFDVNHTNRTPAAAIFWNGAGGLKVTNSKVNGNASTGKFANGFEFSVPDGGSTSDFFINNNSIENITNKGVYFHQTGTTGVLSNIQIANNEIGVGTYPRGVEINCASVGQMNNIVVQGNTILGCTDACVYLNSAKYVTVGGNVFSGSGSPGSAVRVGASNSVTVLPNTIQGGLAFSGGIVSIGSGAVAINVSKQNTSQMNLILYGDSRSAGHSTLGTIDFEDTRSIPSVTSTSTWVQLYRVYAPASGGGAFTIDVSINGVTAGASTPVAIFAKRVATQPTAGGACSVTTVGTDVITDAVNVEYQFDTATISGAVIVSVRLKSGGTATDFSGACSIKTAGTIQYLYRTS